MTEKVCAGSTEELLSAPSHACRGRILTLSAVAVGRSIERCPIQQPADEDGIGACEEEEREKNGNGWRRSVRDLSVSAAHAVSVPGGQLTDQQSHPPQARTLLFLAPSRSYCRAAIRRAT